MNVALIGLPFDHPSSFLRGAAPAPAEIRKAFRRESSNMSSETGVDVSGIGDAGDIGKWDQIEPAIERLPAQGRVPIVPGGDHSVTFPVVKAI